MQVGASLTVHLSWVSQTSELPPGVRAGLANLIHEAGFRDYPKEDGTRNHAILTAAWTRDRAPSSPRSATSSIDCTVLRQECLSGWRWSGEIAPTAGMCWDDEIQQCGKLRKQEVQAQDQGQRERAEGATPMLDRSMSKTGMAQKSTGRQTDRWGWQRGAASRGMGGGQR
ncbi:hypothetical protein DE146DRAFT_438444 [Phaeosphaeria sp. MPI-PUGE-AT-0046c]|nr:hypothetical protein DE146DRAFT_438444 [Phaeosphaeria sp. MPI-PUGE-AT-0046c]